MLSLRTAVPSIDANPTNNNVQGSCVAVFDQHTSCYSISFTVSLDDTFTPAVISVIENLRVGRFEIDAQGSAIPGTVVSDLLPLDSSLEEGPVNLTFPFDDLPQLSNGHGYQLSVSLFMLSVHYEFMLHKIVYITA